MEAKIDSKNNIKSIVKAGLIIDVIAYERVPISLSDLATRLNMAKSTLHGLLSTLVNIGYLEQEQDTGKYKLGVHLFELGSQIANTWNEKRIARAYMTELVEKTGETVHLAMLSNGEVLYVDKQEGFSPIRIVTAPGVKLPAHCTGVGKILLAYSPKERMEQLIDQFGLIQYTSNTITSKDALYSNLKQIKEDGYTYDNQEFLDGLRCVAAPVFDYNGKVIFALSISGPLFRMSDELIEKYRDLLLEATKEISLKLGYRGK